MKKKQNNFFLAHARERDKVRVKRKEYSEGGAGEWQLLGIKLLVHMGFNLSSQYEWNRGHYI